MRRAVPPLALLLVLAACKSGVPGIPGDSDDHQPFAEIAPDDMLHFTGTEPFWGGRVTGKTLSWTTPDAPDGQSIAVSRFAGRGGVSFSGTLEDKPFMLVVTPGQCSDGMSDRTYPYVATVRIGQEERQGCAWSDAHPFEASGPPGNTA